MTDVRSANDTGTTEAGQATGGNAIEYRPLLNQPGLNDWYRAEPAPTHLFYKQNSSFDIFRLSAENLALHLQARFFVPDSRFDGHQFVFPLS